MGKRSLSRDLLLNFGTPSISTERLKIQTSNLVRRFRTRRPIQKLQNYVNWGTGPGLRDLHLNFWTRCITLQRVKTETSNFVGSYTVYAICTFRFVLSNKTANIKYKKHGLL